jgi:methyltransferase (TIGR00027 family)
MKSTTPIQHVSDTAIWMAAYRAMETERPDALFQDPMAKLLVADRGESILKTMAPTARYSYWTLVMRTRVIDAYLLKYINEGYKTVINLGAGLDTRPYRFKVPSDTRWIEIDFAHLVEMKNEKLKDQKPNCSLERISLDLSNRELRRKMFTELNARVGPAIILTEGVIPYLSEPLVAELAEDIRALPNFKLWIAEYYAPELYRRFQAPAFKKSLGNSPFQFFPPDWFGFFKTHGWTVKENEYLYDEGTRSGRSFPLPAVIAFLKRFANPEKFAKRLRMQSYVVFKKTD